MFINIDALEKLKTRRAGVIPYTYYNDTIYFLFGKDSQFGELTDFGGHREQCENSFSTAVREFKEETNSLFAVENLDYKNTIGIIDNGEKMAIIFIRVTENWIDDAQEMFESRKKLAPDEKHKEIQSLVWLSINQLSDILDGKPGKPTTVKMWNKVKYFLKSSMGNLNNIKTSLIAEGGASHIGSACPADI